MSYINKEELNGAMYREAFQKDSNLQKWDSGCWIRYKLFEKVLESIPTVDAVEVVRCKDCKYFRKSQPLNVCTKFEPMLAPDEDDFCSCGVRKETEERYADDY